MKRFAILRDLDPSMTREDIDAGAVESLLSLSVQDVDPSATYNDEVTGVNWVRSYWAPGTSWGMCLYTGPDETAIQRYHEICEVPYVTIREIQETASNRGGRQAGLNRKEPSLLAVETQSDGIAVDADAWGDLSPSWIRSYTDPAAKTVLAIFGGQGRELRAVEAQAAADGWILHRVVEVRPEDYVGHA